MTLLTEIGLFTSKNAMYRRAKTKRMVFDVENITEEIWQDYSKCLDQLVVKKQPKVNRQSIASSAKPESIDIKWDFINKAFEKVTKKTLPKKKSQKALSQKLPNQELKEKRKNTRVLSKLCRKCKNNLAKPIEPIDKDQITEEFKRVADCNNELVETLDLLVLSEELYK